MARKRRSRKVQKPVQTPTPERSQESSTAGPSSGDSRSDEVIPVETKSEEANPEEAKSEESRPEWIEPEQRITDLGWSQSNFFTSSSVDKDLWKRWLATYDVHHADIPLDDKAFEDPKMAAGADSEATMTLTVEEQEGTYTYLIDSTIEQIIHDVLLDVHTAEKTARMQTAVIEVQQRADKLGRGKDSTTNFSSDEPVETKTAIYNSPTSITLKGNPMTTTNHIRCPNCKLLKLLYPRVGYNSRPVPDPSQQYCKSEPMIILDRHDVHGQRKKGVKVKGQPKSKAKTKKGADPGSPAASENSDPLTPSSSIPENQSFDFKEIDFPAAKCPNRDSHLGDHWKSVNVFATHLNGSCYLKRDRAAGREAREKLSGTPKDSRANSPKPLGAANGVKRKAANDDDAAGETTGKLKKKAKLSGAGSGDAGWKKSNNSKKTVPGAPSRLREQTNTNDDEDELGGGGVSTDVSPVKQEMNGDTIQVTPKTAREQSGEPSIKLKFNASGSGMAKKKPGKAGKKA